MMKKTLLVFVCALSLFGCDRYLDSRDPVRPYPATESSPSDLSMEINSESIHLFWQHTNTAGVVNYRVYVSANDTVSYTKIDSTSATDITLDQLTANTQYFITVAAVYDGGWEGPRANPVTTRVGILDMIINNDDETTNSSTVAVDFIFPVTVTHVKISEDPSLNDAEYRTYTPAAPFTLSGGDGVKYLYASLLFADGSVTGDILTDSIIVDTQAASGSFDINLNTTVSTGNSTAVTGLEIHKIDATP